MKEENISDSVEYKAEEFKVSEAQKDALEKALSHVSLISLKLGSIPRKAMSYTPPSSGKTSANNEGGFYDFEYPLQDIGAAEDTEVYLYQANFKKLALAMKEGFAFVGENQETLKYMQKRIKQLEVVQGQTMFSLLSEILGEIFKYHGVFLIKARNRDNSGGFPRKSGDKTIEPVAGYFVASMTSMKFKMGQNNRITHYKHFMPDGRCRIYKAEDVVYFHVYKRPHFAAPTPPWFPALDDIIALRRIEENIESLVYRHINPLFQYKIGTEKAPARRYANGVTEVEVVNSKIMRMAPSGMIVTPERHEIIAIGAESQALRVEGYVKHFKDRVVTGTGMASIDFGDGDTANRATADSLSRIAIGNVKFYQKVVMDIFNFEIVRELLLEGGFGFDVLAPENYVEFMFAEVDIETKIKLQNHFMLLYAGEMITRTEARTQSGFQALKPDQEQDIKENPALIAAKTKPAPGASSSSDSLGSARSRQQPSNQHGKLSGPTKARSSIQKDSRASDIYRELTGDIYSMSPKSADLGYVRQIFMAAEKQIVSSIEDSIDRNVNAGMAGFERSERTINAARSAATQVKASMRGDVNRLIVESAVKTMAKLALGKSASGILDSIEYRMEFIANTIGATAFNLSRAKVMKSMGIDRAVVTSHPDGKDFLLYDGLVIDLLTVEDEDLPPFHPNCRCTIGTLEERNG